MIGQKFGPYEIMGYLGQGGMAMVYRARQPSLNRDVALKILSGSLAADVSFRQRFRQEALIVAALEHPNIVPIYDVGEQDGIPYVAMRYVTGRTLAQMLLEEGPLRAERAIHYVAQVAEALNFAHSRGVIHRDVKPSNIIVDQGGNAYLMDFGIAQLIGGARFTQTGALVGTPDYMAPEQIRGQTLDARTDIYALGAVIYELLAGRAPFKRDDPLATLYAHVHEPVPALTAGRAAVSPGLEAVVLRSLAKAPAARFSSALAFGEALPSPTAHIRAVAEPRARRGVPGWMIAAAGAVVVTIGVTLAAMANQPTTVSPEPTLVPTNPPAPSLAATIAPTIASTEAPQATPTSRSSGLALAPGEARRLVAGPGQNYTPAFSHDSQWIAWVNNSSGEWRIRLARVADIPGTTVELAGQVGNNQKPAFSPDGKEIAFGSNRAGKYDIYVANLDGTNLRRLTHGEGNSEYPAFSPDGRQIFFMSDRGGAFRIYSMNYEGGNLHEWLNPRSADRYPSFSSDGRLLAWQSTIDGNEEVYVVELPSGIGARRLTNNRARDAVPSFSPDEQWVVFESNRTGHHEIYAVPASGGEAHSLTPHSGDYGDWVASVSPDRQWLLYQSNRAGDGTMDIYVQAFSP